MDASTPGGARDRLLFLLKTRGPQSAKELAGRLQMTPMGARQHLALLEEQGVVASEERRGGVGRPAHIWSLTRDGHAQFPDTHADLTVDILQSVRRTFGEKGLGRLVRDRTREQERLYRERMPAPGAPLAARVRALAALRRDEGYMAEVRAQREGFLLVENHCPICAAATECQGLCQAELQLFRRILGPDAHVERTDHLLAGARRCAYRITPRPPTTEGAAASSS